MADPKTSSDVEDVLSSIRRLVSQDRTPVIRPAEAAENGAAGRLVLTPALRVVEAAQADLAPPDQPAGMQSPRDDDDPWRAIRPETALSSVGSVGDEAWRHLSADAPGANPLEATIAELEAAVAGFDDQFEPDGDGTDASGDTGTALATAWRQEGGASPSPNALAATAATPCEAASVAEAEEPATWPEDTGLESEHPSGSGPAGIGDSDPMHQGFRSGDATSSDFERGDPRRLHLAAIGDVAEDIWHAPAAEDDSLEVSAGIAEPYPGEERVEQAAPALPRRIFIHRHDASEDPAGERLTDRIPSDTVASDEKPPVPFPASATEEEAPAVHVSTSSPARERNELSAPDVDLAALLADPDSREMVRRLVADVLRDELRGTLGERITLNVRKLVRREVTRLLEERGLG